MPEEIFNFVAPIAVIPPQQVLQGRINEMRKKIARTRKKETKDLLNKELATMEQSLASNMKSLGR